MHMDISVQSKTRSMEDLVNAVLCIPDECPEFVLVHIGNYQAQNRSSGPCHTGINGQRPDHWHHSKVTVKYKLKATVYDQNDKKAKYLQVPQLADLASKSYNTRP